MYRSLGESEIRLRYCGDEKSLLYMLAIEPQIFFRWPRLKCRKEIVRGAQFYAHGTVGVAVLSVLKMEAAGSSETAARFCRPPQCCISDDINL